MALVAFRKNTTNDDDDDNDVDDDDDDHHHHDVDDDVDVTHSTITPTSNGNLPTHILKTCTCK